METQEDLDRQCQGRPEGEIHLLDQDWRGDKKHRGLDKSFKSFIVSSMMEERKEEGIVAYIIPLLYMMKCTQ